MKYLLDTSHPDDLVVFSIVKAELLYGARKSQRREKNENRLEVFFFNIPSLPFDNESAEQYAMLRNMLEKAGIVIGANDLLIAAVAQQHGLTIVTRNQREFGMIPTLKTEIW